LVEDEEMKDDHHSVTVLPRGLTESTREMNVRLKSTVEMKEKGRWRRKERE
jgi:hypothetical protein